MGNFWIVPLLHTESDINAPILHGSLGLRPFHSLTSESQAPPVYAIKTCGGVDVLLHAINSALDGRE